ncbi:MAG TPA: TlpA disulfide reductase family protein [Polyangiaceae bacterium]|nr:TlpA disulfide reductase family protein [Polyangiaceae bacterium]
MEIGRFRIFALLPLFAGAPIALGCGGASAGSPGSTQETSGLVGRKAPNFSVDTVAGSKGQVSIANLRGKVVLIDFWATFCEPCKKSFPKLQALQSKYDANGLKIVGISEDEVEDKDKIPHFAHAYGAKFTLAWDGDKGIAQSYKPETMPSSFLVDKMGVVRFAHVGYHDGDAALLDKEIQGLLQR